MRYMTAAGIRALKHEQDAVREQLCCTKQDKEPAPVGHSAERLYEFNEGRRDEGIQAARLAAICQQLEGVQEAPIPCQFEKVQLGHMVVMQHLEPHEDRGTFACIIGGEHEPSAFPHVQTISNVSPYGRALISKEVGDDVEITLPGHGRVHVEIIEIKLPPEDVQQQLALDAANAA